MAATHFDAAVPSTSFAFDIYNDGQPAQAELNIPSGPCHFADTSPGANGARCGCRRFYSRQGATRGPFADSHNSDQALWCMCSHHACFHDLYQPGQVPAPAVDGVTVAGQENERPRANREPLSPVQTLGSFKMPSSLGAALDLNLLDFPPSFPFPKLEATNAASRIAHSPGQDSSMPDTLDWGAILESPPARTDFLPPIPQQCLMPSQPPSTASSSQARYLRPFAGKGLQTLSGASVAKSQEPTPLERISECLISSDPADVSRMEISRASRPPEDAQSSATARGVTGDAFQHVSKVVQGHEQRLDRLETVSFSAGHEDCQAKHEECEEKHDHTDLRVTELESRVEEVERMLNSDNSSSGSARGLAGRDTPDDATVSVVSVATNTMPLPDRAELYSQLEALKAQISYLHASAAPSYGKPWELEVVFLPFPLKGIWIEACDFPITTLPDAPGNGDEWTQMPSTATRSAPDPSSPNGSAFFGDIHGQGWLLPRACAPGRVIDRRLRSRGLVKTVLVRGSDARSVQLAVNTAFSDVLRVSDLSKTSRALVHLNGHNDEDCRLPAALGPRQSWVPLRKIHKDSRLRFLSPGEMVTPSLWDYAFLTSSVVMKASGIHRLYITSRESYLQDHPVGYRAFESGWTWQRLRELTRVYPDSQSSNGDVPEADAMEDCWAWNDRLDEAPSFNASSAQLRPAPASRSFGRRPSPSPSQYFTGIQSPILSNSPKPVRVSSPLVAKDSKGPRPRRLRTNSLPPCAPIVASPSLPKRRISAQGITTDNHPYERRHSPFVSRPNPRPGFMNPATAGNSYMAKRRQYTKSPSLIPRNTPRWSQRIMSRSPSSAPYAAQGYGHGHGHGHGDDRSERRTTPFHYATPRSNVAAETFRANSRGPVIHAAEYYADEDDDMEDDHGSSTDPYDSEMTNDVDADYLDARRKNGLGRGMADDDGDFDIDVYEDEPDNLDNLVTDDGSPNEQYQHGTDTATGYLARQGYAHGQAHAGEGGTLPEDEPWPGIEDRMSDGENMNPMSPSTDGVDVDVQIGDVFGRPGDAASDVSSQPSEYPSTQRAWHVTEDTEIVSKVQRQDSGEGSRHGQVELDSGVEFHIHEDIDTDHDGLESQWA